MERRNFLVTLFFEDKEPTDDIETENKIRQDIMHVLKEYHKNNRIKHWIIANDEAIAEKFKERAE